MAARTGSVQQIINQGAGTRVQFTAPAAPAFVVGERYDIQGMSDPDFDRRYRVVSVVNDFTYDCDVTPRAAPFAAAGDYVEVLDPVSAGDLPAGQIDAGLVVPFGAQIHPEG